MINSYFEDMTDILDRICGKLSSDGRIIMVVGDSRYAGIHIDVAAILEELSETIGLSVEHQEPIRSMRTSPQQGGRHDLEEVLLRLVRC